MIINDVDYPDLLINAIKNDRLVFFAGAGVSMGEPTNLPSFNNLSNQIAQLTNEPKEKNESDEQYLGRIKNLGHNVNEEVCSILNKSNLIPNTKHSTLVNFFNKDNIRIVTTNYDLMFEKIIEKNNQRTIIYSYPALPRGDNFKGVVHLHGEVNNPSNIVLTDSDFGKSYMYHGYVTLFLRALFESEYVVLFVGYSYSDIIMKYFTKSLPDLSGEKRFIFASEEQAENYKSLGLTPIIYRKGDYNQIYDSLSCLSKLVTRDDNEWNLRIIDIVEEKPDKMNDEFNYEVGEILSDIHYSDKFFDKLKGKEWAQYLFNQGYFDDIFSKKTRNDFRFKKIEWLSKNIIIDELKLFIEFCYRKDFILSIDLQNEIANIICNRNIEIDKIRSLMNLIDFNDINYYFLKNLLDVCYKNSPSLDIEASEIFSTSLKFEFKKDRLISKDGLKIQFRLNEYEIISLWEQYKLFNKKHYINILNHISDQLQRLARFSTIGIIVENFIFSSFYEEECIDEKDAFIFVFSQLLSGLDGNYKEYWLYKHISSNLTILVRSALFLLRNITTFTAKDKLKFLKDRNIKIFTPDLKEELFMLYSDIFPKLEDSDKKVFIKELLEEEKLCDNYDDESFYYQKYNLLIWLSHFDNISYIDDNIKSILDRYSYFEPRSNPQKSFGPIITKWGDAPLPYLKSEIVNNLEDLFNELLVYSGDGFKKAERSTLIQTVSAICSSNIDFREKLIDMLLSTNEFDNDLWKGVISSLGNVGVSEQEFIKTFDKIFKTPLIEKQSFEFCFAINKFLENQKEVNNELLDSLYEKIVSLWPYTTNFNYDTNDYMTKAINSSKGYISLSVVHIIKFSVKNFNQRILSNRFKVFLEKMIYEDVYSDSLVVLLGNASFWYSLDQKWCENHILNKFNPENPKLFNIAWEGFSYQSILYLEFALKMEPIFHEAIKNIDVCEKTRLKKEFVTRYILLMVNIGDNPIKDYIPNIFTKDVSKDIIKTFYFELGKYIKSLNEDERKEIAEKWVFKFLENRTRSFPVPIKDYEKNLILKFILQFPEAAENLTLILKDFNNPFAIELDIIYTIYYSIKINEKNSNIITLVLIILTNQMKFNTEKAIPFFIQIAIKEIYEKISAVGVKDDDLESNLRVINIIE